MQPSVLCEGAPVLGLCRTHAERRASLLLRAPEGGARVSGSLQDGEEFQNRLPAQAVVTEHKEPRQEGDGAQTLNYTGTQLDGSV